MSGTSSSSLAGARRLRGAGLAADVEAELRGCSASRLLPLALPRRAGAPEASSSEDSRKSRTAMVRLR